MSKSYALGMTDADYKQVVNHLDKLAKVKEQIDIAKSIGVDTSDLENHHAYLTDALNNIKQVVFKLPPMV